MGRHILTFIHYALLGAILAALLLVGKDIATLSHLVIDLREAVAMIEEGAHQAQEAAVAFDDFLQEQRCIEDQGEWHPEFGCSLQIIQE